MHMWNSPRFACADVDDGGGHRPGVGALLAVWYVEEDALETTGPDEDPLTAMAGCTRRL